MPLVSVLMRCREQDRIPLLRQAIHSVQCQSFPDWEIILVHDGVIPEFARLVASLREPRLRYHEAGFVGRAAALNAAIRLAAGYYVAYLDDDDAFQGHHLETLVTAALRSGGRFVHSDIGVPEAPGGRETDAWARLLGGNYVFNCTALHERSLFAETGYFDEELVVMEDWDMWLRMARVTPLIHVPKATVTVSDVPGEEHRGPRWDEAKERILAKWRVAA